MKKIKNHFWQRSVIGIKSNKIEIYNVFIVFYFFNVNVFFKDLVELFSVFYIVQKKFRDSPIAIYLVPDLGLAFLRFVLIYYQVQRAAVSHMTSRRRRSRRTFTHIVARAGNMRECASRTHCKQNVPLSEGERRVQRPALLCDVAFESADAAGRIVRLSRARLFRDIQFARTITLFYYSIIFRLQKNVCVLEKIVIARNMYVKY